VLERYRGLEPRLRLLGKQVPYLLGEYRERAILALCRPYRDRTGVLLIESQASVPLLRRPEVLRACPRRRTGTPPGFSRALCLLSLAGMGVEQRGIEPLASGLPNRRSTC
jgi:hypothetical protein